MSLAAHIFTLGICFGVGHSSTTTTEQKTSAINEVLRDLPSAMCDFIVVSSLPFLGEILLHNFNRVIWRKKIIYEIRHFLGTGRSSFFFTNLEQLYSKWDKTELARQVASMPCLIAFVKADSFTEAMQFVGHISSLNGNAVKNRKKHLILMTPTIDHSLLQNKTVHFKVHIVSQGKTGLGQTVCM